MKVFIEKIKKDKKLIVIIAVGIVGMLILLFSGNPFEKKENVTEETTSDIHINIDDVEKAVENRLSGVLADVKGAGSVKVMVTLDSAGEYIYAKNSKNESGSNSYSSDNEYVIYENDSGSETGLVLCVKNPEVRGVAVVCDGGDSAVIKKEITGLVTSLFGIGSNQVYVGSKSQ